MSITKVIKIYTDGSSKPRGNSRVGGWAYVVLEEEKIGLTENGYEEGATNQQMELLAPIKALENILELDEEVIIQVYSDSAYLINCYKDQWWINWEENGWRNSKRQPVANQELWKQLIPYFRNPKITWHKVEGHSGDKFNEVADDLAQAAVDKQEAILKLYTNEECVMSFNKNQK